MLQRAQKRGGDVTKGTGVVLGKGKRTSCELPKRQGQQEVTSLSGPQGTRGGPKLLSPEKAGLSRKANIAGGLRESSHFENHRGAEQKQEESRREEIPRPPSHPVFPSAVRAFHWPTHHKPTPNPPHRSQGTAQQPPRHRTGHTRIERRGLGEREANGV